MFGRVVVWECGCLDGLWNGSVHVWTGCGMRGVFMFGRVVVWECGCLDGLWYGSVNIWTGCGMRGVCKC